MLFMSILAYFIGVIKGVHPVFLVSVSLRIEPSSLQLLDAVGNSLRNGCVIAAGRLFSLSYSHNEETELANNDLSGFFWK